MVHISIIIPCYNAGNYISKCFFAFENQTFKNFDLVLVNDCSKDNTEEIISKWKEKGSLGIIYLKNAVNSGPATSRSNGVKVASGEWIAFCDSDDWYEPEYLEKMVGKAELDSCDVVFCGYNAVIGTEKTAHNLVCSTKVMLPREALLLNVDSLCMTLVKRKIILNIPQPELRNGEDMAMMPLIISKAQRIGAIPDSLYNYNFREGSASMTPSMKVVDSLVKSFDFINANMSDDYYVEKEYIGIRNVVYGVLLNLFKVSYDTKKASEILKHFEVSFPSWGKNPYISNLPLIKFVYVKFAQYRVFAVLRVLSLLHQRLTK